MQIRSVGDLELGRFRLPVSGRWVAMRHPGGAEDLLLAEAARTPGGDAAVALALAGRLGRAVEGDRLDVEDLTVTDLDCLVLRLRQALIGDRIRADMACPARGCGRRLDMDFSIEEFLDHHAPRTPRGRGRGRAAEPAEEPGWFRLGPPSATSGAEEGVDDVGVLFRLPTAADLLRVASRPEPERELARLCLRPADVPARLRRRAEAAMEAMAPSLSGDLQGRCPECGAAVTAQFDARWFCLRELRDRAAFIYQDVDLLARRYHWSEAAILAMPHGRRAMYAELARRAEGA